MNVLNISLHSRYHTKGSSIFEYHSYVSALLAAMDEKPICIYYLLACKTWEFHDMFCEIDSYSDTLIDREVVEENAVQKI